MNNNIEVSYPYKILYICENDVFDDQNRVKLQKQHSIQCEQGSKRILKINNSFVEEFQLYNNSQINISYIYEGTIDPRVYSSSIIWTGINSVEYNQEKYGFPWCHWQSFGLIRGLIVVNSIFLDPLALFTRSGQIYFGDLNHR